MRYNYTQTYPQGAKTSPAPLTITRGKSVMKFLPYFTLFIVFCMFGFMHAHAQSPESQGLNNGSGVEILPQSDAAQRGMSITSGLATHAPLKISPDKSEIVTLEQDAGTIIVGNPAHLNVLADSAKRLILVPRAPGATFFTVLNQDGDTIMQRHILIAPPKENYLRVRRSCAGNEACVATSVYYCPDTCHEVALPQASKQGAAAPPAGGSGDANAEELQQGAEDLSGAATEAQDVPDR